MLYPNQQVSLPSRMMPLRETWDTLEGKKAWRNLVWVDCLLNHPVWPALAELASFISYYMETVEGRVAAQAEKKGLQEGNTGGEKR